MVARLTLDSGALSALASGEPGLRAALRVLQRHGAVAIVPAPVLAESTTGRGPADAAVNHVVKRLTIAPCDEAIARRAGALRFAAGRPKNTLDALVVATAEQAGGGVVFTGDPDDLGALATGTTVRVESI